jgi:tetratricopeptide (TPR) repeat protein
LLYRSLLIGLCLGPLSACDATGGFGHSGLSNPDNAPPAADGSRPAQDGLEVGHRLLDAGEYELALKAYLRAASEQGVNADVLSAIGSANLKLERLGQAEQVLRRALEIEPDFVPALNNLGVVLMEQGKYGEAKLIFQQAFALDSGQSDSIRENLRIAIAKLEAPVYGDPEQTEEPVYQLLRQDEGESVVLTEL